MISTHYNQFTFHDVNPAVIKAYLKRLPKEQLVVHGRYMRRKVLSSPFRSNEQMMWLRLYRYAQELYRHKTKKPLFLSKQGLSFITESNSSAPSMNTTKLCYCGH